MFKKVSILLMTLAAFLLVAGTASAKNDRQEKANSKTEKRAERLETKIQRYIANHEVRSSGVKITPTGPDGPRGAPVPEPSAALIFGLGLLAASRFARKR